MKFARSHGETTFTLPERGAVTIMGRGARVEAPDGTRWTLPDEDGMAMAAYVVPPWWKRLMGQSPCWVVVWCTTYSAVTLRPDEPEAEAGE
jgi:hypothetical protein